MREIRNSTEVTGNLNANEEHTHDIGDDDGGDAGRSKGGLDGLGTVLVECKVKEDDADAAEYEHEAGGEALDDVLAVDSAGEEDDGAHGAGVGVLGGSDAGGLDDDVVDEAGDDGEVGEEEEGEDGGGRGKGECWELEARARDAEEAVRHHLQEVEDWIHPACQAREFLGFSILVSFFQFV